MQGENVNLLVTIEHDCRKSLNVFDMSGKLVHSQTLQLRQGSNIFSLDLDGLSGIYLVNVGSLTRRILVLSR